MAQFDLKFYARRGAEVRLRELRDEMKAILGAFPDLRDGESTTENGSMSVRAARRRRTRMTAAQRKAVSARMKKYWAARRKTEK